MPYKVNVDEFPPIVREFASYKTAIQGCSQKTVQEYLLDLRTFFRYLIAREQDIPFLSKEFEAIDVSSIGLTELERIHPEDLYEFLYYTNNTRNNQGY